jgi:hypothetical protein
MEIADLEDQLRAIKDDNASLHEQLNMISLKPPIRVAMSQR